MIQSLNHNLMSIKRFQSISTMKLLFSVALSILGVYLLYSGTYFGLIFLAIAGKFAMREGIELDLQNKRYRKVYTLLGIVFGHWKKLPVIEYVSVFKTKKKTRSRVITAEATLDFVVYKVNLFYQRNKHIEAYIADEKEEAFKIAQDIATSLAIDIHDAT